MKSSVKRIALSILLAIAALILCVFSGNAFRSDNNTTADAAGAYTTISVDVSPKIIAPGETFTVTVTVESTRSAYNWSSFSLAISPLKDDPSKPGTKIADTDLIDKFEFVSFTHNLTGLDDQATTYFNEVTDSAVKVGLCIEVGDPDGKEIPATTKFIGTAVLKVKEDAGNISNLSFGVGQSKPNIIGYGGSKNISDRCNNTSSDKTATGTIVEINNATIRIGSISSDATLKSLNVGHGTADQAVTLNNDGTLMTYTDNAENKGDLKVKAEVNDSAAKGIKYGVNTSANPTPDQDYPSSGVIDVPATASNTGEVYVSFLVTAEDDSTKRYDLKIVSSYARLSDLALQVNRPSGAPAVSGTTITFAKETFTYNVTMPSDNTGVTLKPTILVNQGSTGVDVATTDCTANNTTVASGSNLTISQVTQNSSVVLTVNAKDGTKQNYTVNFEYKNCDTSISDITMTADITGDTVNNDAAKATSNSAAYYFQLKENANFQGTFNITGYASTSTVTIGTDAYPNTTKYTAGTYNVKVVAEAGNEQTYKVIVAKEIAAGSIKDLKYAVKNDSGYIAVDGSNSTYDAGSNTYTVKVDVDLSTNAVGTAFYIQGTASTGASISAASPLSQVTANSKWSGSLSRGANTFRLSATSSEGTTVYIFNVNLVEGKNTITDISVKNSANATPDGFFFNPNQTSYTLTVPFTGYDSLNFTATTDGYYTTVVGDVGGTARDFTSSTSSQSHTLNSIALTAGSPTTVKVYAVADEKQGAKSDKEYTFTINRAAAETGALLASLDVTINGTPVSFKEGAFNPATNNWNIEISSDGTASASVGISATAQSSVATVKIGTGTATVHTATATESFAYASNTKTFSIEVKAESGATNTYTVKITKVVPPPEFTDLQISFVNEYGYSSVLTATEYDPTTSTYTVTKALDTDVAVGDRVYLKGTTTSDATVSVSNLSNSASGWNGTLNHNENRYVLTVRATGKPDKVYTVIVKVLEDKYDVTDVAFTVSGSPIEYADGTNFSFSQWTNTYTFKTPYKGYESVLMTVTTNGKYTIVVDGKGATLTSTNTSTDHTQTVSLKAGQTTTVEIQAIADGDKTNGNKSTTYTFNIERSEPDRNAKLQSLDLTIDGTPVTEFDGGVYFDPDTLTYNYTITYTGASSAKIEINAVPQSATATVAGASGTVIGGSGNTYTFPSSSGTKAYTIVVTPESGATADIVRYTVNIVRTIQKGDFTDVEVSTDNSYFESVFSQFTGSGTASDPKVCTVTKLLSDAAVGSKFYIKPTVNSADAKITPTSGLTLRGDVLECTLSKFGVNTFKFSAKSGGGETVYTINVELNEDLDDISDIVILNGTTPLSASDFTFAQGNNYYTVNVASDVTSVKVRITPEGKYAYVYETGDTRITTKVGSAYEKTLALKAGDTTTLVVYAKANEGKGTQGMEYTLDIVREPADEDSLLTDLVVKIDGVEVPFKDATFDPNTNDYFVEFEKTGTSAKVEFVATASSANAKLSGTGYGTAKTFSFTANAEKDQDYTIIVTAPSGAKSTYTVNVKRIIVPGDFTTLEFAASGNNYEDVLSSAYFDPDTKTYTIDLSMDTTSVGATVKFKATPTNGATVTVSSNVTKPTSTTSNIYTAKLAHGENIFTFEAKAGTASAGVYTFIVNLYEGKNTITDIEIKNGKTALDSKLFNFRQSQSQYDFVVPYSVSSLTMTVTTDGSFVNVTDELDNVFDKVNPNATRGTTKHERVISLDAGDVTTLVFRGVSDKLDDGDWYEFRITREEANEDTTLSKLEVTIGGVKYEFEEGEFDPETLEYTIQVDAKPSYSINIVAESTAGADKAPVTGAGAKTFKLTDADSTMVYPITVKAENGDERTYNITISQKAVVRDSNYDITRIVINGMGTQYYNSVPAEYNVPEQITVPYNVSSVSIVVTMANANAKSEIKSSPNEFANGYVRLVEGDNTVMVYGVAEDGSNESGMDCYVFNIVRAQQGETTGPNTTIKFDNNQVKKFDINTTDALIYILDDVDYSKATVNFTVELNLGGGGNYAVRRVIKNSGTDGQTEFEDEITSTVAGSEKSLNLAYGVNVFSVDIDPIDGNNKKSAILIVERKLPSLTDLGAAEISQLRKDFDQDRNEYSYSVESSVDKITLDVDLDKDLLRYEIDGPDSLDYGMNEFKILIFDRTAARASGDAVRTISVSVFRQKDNSFWLIMTCVLAALALVLIIICILVGVNKKKNDEPPIILTSSGAPAQAQQNAQQPVILQQGQQPIYLPPQDGQY